MPHLRGLPETSPGSSCRCTWIGPRCSPSFSSLCPAGEAQRVRRGARPAPRPPPALAGPHRAHRHLARAARLSGGTAPVPFDPAPHASAAPAVRLRGAARRGVAGKHLATPVAGTRQHGGGGGGAGVARGGLPPPRGPGEGCARPAGPAGCGDPASRYPAARRSRPSRPGGSLGDTRPRAGGSGARSPAVTLRACPRPGSLLLLESPLHRRSVPRGSEVWGTFSRPPALLAHLGVSNRCQGRSCLPWPGGCPSPTSVSPYVRCQRPPWWLW